MQHIVEEFAQAIRDAGTRGQALRIRGGGSKDFYGGVPRGEVLATTAYAGIVDYEPTELVITARAGTPIADIESAMRDRRQMLAFEPPRFSSAATLGGSIAAGLSGPRRPYAGSARDLVLGVRLLDGRATDLSFGGRVMKNVAGYDVARLMAGSLGTLGLLLDISLKALPLPARELTLKREHDEAQAIELMNTWAGLPLPITATCHFGDVLHVRLSGAEPAVHAARRRLGGEVMTDDAAFWSQVRDQTLPFFSEPRSLWRVALKSTAPPLALGGTQIMEWNGGLRWVAGDLETPRVREAASRHGGHATLFRGGAKNGSVFHPLPKPLLELHRRLKATFDPHGVLNPGRMYAEF